MPTDSGSFRTSAVDSEAIAQLGGVVLGDDVSIGAATTIDRGAIDDTVIGDGVKIDNQVQIGHNCEIGDHTLICGCVGIVGSTRIGRHCVLAGGVGIGGDGPIEIADRVVVSANDARQSFDREVWRLFGGRVPQCDTQMEAQRPPVRRTRRLGKAQSRSSNDVDVDSRSTSPQHIPTANDRSAPRGLV